MPMWGLTDVGVGEGLGLTSAPAARHYAIGIPSADGVCLRTSATSDMMSLTPMSLRSVAVIGARCDDIAADLIPTQFQDRPVLGYEIFTWQSDLPCPSLYPPVPTDTAHEKARLLTQCHPSRSGRGWSDDDAILRLMWVRGVQCRARLAEAFTVEKSVLESGSDYSVD